MPTVKPKVLLTDSYFPSVVSFLNEHVDVSIVDTNSPQSDPKDLSKLLFGFDAVMCKLNSRFSEAVFAQSPQLKMIANVAVGYDNVDVSDAIKYGVLVSNTPGVLNETVADLTFALVLACGRRLIEADRYARSGAWHDFDFHLLAGTDIYNKCLGIIGFGRIGQAVARRALGFGMKVIYNQRSQADASVEAELKARYVDFDTLLAESDYLVVMCPLTDATHHLISEAQLAKMKRTAFIINTARGAIIDEKALVRALQNKIIAGAGLDVFEHEPSICDELKPLDNVVLSPHVGSSTLATREQMALMAAQSIVDAFGGKRPSNLLNPQVWPQFCEYFKLANAAK